MTVRPSHRLFHAIVLMGVAMASGACAEEASSREADAGSGDAASGDAPLPFVELVDAGVVQAYVTTDAADAPPSHGFDAAADADAAFPTTK